MRFIKYMETIPVAPGYYFLVNGLNGAVDTIDEEGYQICQAWLDQNEITPNTELERTAFQYLQSRGYLCSADEDKQQRASIIETIKANLASQSKSLNVNFTVTYNCNFRCTYCYEKNLQKNGSEWLQKRMSPQMVRSIYNHFAEEGMTINQCVISGGEPLLPANMDTVTEILEQNKKYNYSTIIITNGYNLSHYIDLLKKYSLKYIQITLDGPKDVHDHQRVLANHEGTFNQIIDGIVQAQAAGLPIALRYNMDYNQVNETDLDQLIATFKMHQLTDSPNISLYTAPYMASHCSPPLIFDHPQVTQKLQELPIYRQNILNNIPLSSAFVDQMIWQPKYIRCQASLQNRLIDPFGDVYSCEILVGEQDQKIGSFTGTTFEYNINHELWQQRNIDTLKKCQTCWAAFICGGGCGYQALQTTGQITNSDCSMIHTLKNTYLPYLFRRFIQPTLQ